MTTIVLNDLNESREMDREAMRAVTGGCAESSYLSQSPYSSSIKTPYNPTQNSFSWISEIAKDYS